MRKEFNNLVELMNRYDLYQKDDEVGVALNDLSNKIVEVEKRMDCAIRSNKDNEVLVLKLANSFQDEGKLEEFINYGEFETLERSVHDVDIALDLNDTECIDNDWYGLFVEPKEEIDDKFKPRSVAEYVATLPNEEPPTDLCKTPQTHEFVKDIIAKLKVIDVDGETMQYILEQVGMEEQIHRQLVMKNDYSATKDLMREKFETDLLNSDI
jgi:hypothetical protein